MHHKFFSGADNVAHNSAAFHNFKYKSHDLKVRPNAIIYGVSVETNESGRMVAAVHPNGDSLRNHYQYVIRRSFSGNTFTDLQQRIHPLD